MSHYLELKKLTKRFFEILDEKETSMNDHTFSPTYVRVDAKPPFKVSISCCRTMRVQELDRILRRMKEIANEYG